MKLLLQFYILILTSFTSSITTVSALYARPGCNDTCGTTRIPYQFGIGSDTQIVITTNVEGCGNAVILEQGNLLTGCSSICQNETISIKRNKRNNCYGINCCQTTLPYYLESYSVNVSGLRGLSGNSCGSAFLVDERLFSAGRSSGLGRFLGQSVVVEYSFVPISLRWRLTERDIISGNNCDFRGEQLYLGNGTSVDSYRCSCSPVQEGSPYLRDGCQLVEACASCIGECHLIGGNITCIPNPFFLARSKSSTIGVILGVSISVGVLMLTATTFALYKLIQKTKDKRRKQRFFKRNGGLLLKQQESADEGLVDKTTLFTAKQLEKATDYFNENRILGRGGQGTVYKGKLTDGRIVAVKKSKRVDESQLEQFINEVAILSQVNHRNVVKLLGCCLETEVPLLVSEFISNGTSYAIIHDDSDEFPITLNARLRIATEIAGALAYLHSATSIPIYHRDIKSTNILLDDKYRAKVSDFGTSRFVSIDQTHLTTLVKGTFGYLDPQYFQSGQFTEKSDVYSFGVVLVELLTGERPILLTRFGEHRSLATRFMMAMEEGQVMSIIDARIVNEGARGELMAVANLAMQCLNLNGKNRPTMKEVASELESIRATHVPSTVVHKSFKKSKYHAEEEEEELIELSYDYSTI